MYQLPAAAKGQDDHDNNSATMPPQPFSRLERENPPPRRKSCAECVKAKRRCSQTLPLCHRCTQRQLRCQYPAQARGPLRSRATRLPAPPVPTVSEQPAIEGDLVLDDSCLDQGFWVDAQTPAASLDSDKCWRGNAQPGAEVATNTAFLDPLGPVQNLDSLPQTPLWMSSALDSLFFDGQATQIQGLDSVLERTAAPKETFRAAILDQPAGSMLQAATFTQIDLEAISQEVQNKLQYAVDIIKNAPKAMLLHLETPWSHPLLYKDQMPTAMQEALSACALYTSKTAINGPIIMRCIDAKVKSLLASEPAEGFLEALSRTQALILYQIMRFFDGDIAARSSADAMFADLHASAWALASHIDWETQKEAFTHSFSSFSDMDMQACRQFWYHWVLKESARRTFLIACFFGKVWRLLTGREGVDCHSSSSHFGEYCLNHNWTLSAHLWNARDAFEFAVAWRDKKHYVVKRKKVLSTLADAHGDDMESFGKMLLTVALGIDGAKAWLALKGGSL